MPKLIMPQNRRRVAYAWQEGDEFLLSPFEAVQSGRRPIARFDDKQSLIKYATDKGHVVQWQ